MVCGGNGCAACWYRRTPPISRQCCSALNASPKRRTRTQGCGVLVLVIGKHQDGQTEPAHEIPALRRGSTGTEGRTGTRGSTGTEGRCVIRLTAAGNLMRGRGQIGCPGGTRLVHTIGAGAERAEELASANSPASGTLATYLWTFTTPTRVPGGLPAQGHRVASTCVCPAGKPAQGHRGGRGRTVCPPPRIGLTRTTVTIAKNSDVARGPARMRTRGGLRLRESGCSGGGGWGDTSEYETPPRHPPHLVA